MKTLFIIIGAVVSTAIIMSFAPLLVLSIVFKWPAFIIFILSVPTIIEFVIVVWILSVYVSNFKE